MAVQGLQPKKARGQGMVDMSVVATGGGAATNCTLSANSVGVTSVAYHSSTGNYRITMDEEFVDLLGVSITFLSTSACIAQVKTVTLASKIVDIVVMKESAGTFAAADLTTSDKMYITFTWLNTKTP